MSKLPRELSITDAARLLNCPVGIIAIDMGLAQVRGNEVFSTSDLLARYKCPPELFVNFVSGNDRALTKRQAAEMLGIRPHSLNIFHVTRATIVPVLAYGDGNGRGFRYSRKAVENHLALEAARGAKPRTIPAKVAAKPMKRPAKRAANQAAQALAVTP